MMGTQPAYAFVLCLFCWRSVSLAASLAAFLSLLSAIAACSYPAVDFMLGDLFGFSVGFYFVCLFCLFVFGLPCPALPFSLI
jgi:hypothetical protein